MSEFSIRVFDRVRADDAVDFVLRGLERDGCPVVIPKIEDVEVVVLDLGLEVDDLSPSFHRCQKDSDHIFILFFHIILPFFLSLFQFMLFFRSCCSFVLVVLSFRLFFHSCCSFIHSVLSFILFFLSRILCSSFLLFLVCVLSLVLCSVIRYVIFLSLVL